MKTINKTIQPDPNTPMPIGYFTDDLHLASRTTIWRWMGQGLKTIRVGGRVFISQADLQQFLADQNEGGGR